MGQKCLVIERLNRLSADRGAYRGFSAGIWAFYRGTSTAGTPEHRSGDRRLKGMMDIIEMSGSDL